MTHLLKVDNKAIKGSRRIKRSDTITNATLAVWEVVEILSIRFHT